MFQLSPDDVMRSVEAYMLKPDRGAPPLHNIESKDLPSLAGPKVQFFDPFRKKDPDKPRSVQTCATQTPTGKPREGFNWSPAAKARKLVIVSASGGIDSAALLVRARKKYPRAMMLILRADPGMEPPDTLETLLQVATYVRAPILNLLPPKSLPQIMRDRGVVVNKISMMNCSPTVKGDILDRVGCWLVRNRKPRTTVHLSGLLYEEPSRVYTQLLLQDKRFGPMMREEALLYDERITKAKAIAVLQRAGLPISSTYFDRGRHGCVPCKHWGEPEWKRYFQTDQAGFAAAVAMEKAVAKTAEAKGKGKQVRVWLLGRAKEFPKGLYLTEWLRVWDREDPGWRKRETESGILKGSDLSCETPSRMGPLPVLTTGRELEKRVSVDVERQLRKSNDAYWRKAVKTLGRRNKPFPLPPDLDLPTLEWGDWVGLPAQTKPRWNYPLKLWKVQGPRKSLGIWLWKTDPVYGFYAVRLKEGRKWAGHVTVSTAYTGGEKVFVVQNSWLAPHLRGMGLGSLMYIAARQAVESYEFKTIKMIPTSEYITGTGTSPEAAKVWTRLRSVGRLNSRERNTYPWLSLKQIARYEDLMRQRGVSKVARSSRGFLTAYKEAGGRSRLSPEWRIKRDNFIARHIAQAQRQGRELYEEKGKYQGTPKRWHLALIAWGYSPEKGKKT